MHIYIVCSSLMGTMVGDCICECTREHTVIYVMLYASGILLSINYNAFNY